MGESVAGANRAPKRIQLKRTKGWRKPEGAVSVARPSKWGNPYKVGTLLEDGNRMTPYQAVVLFHMEITVKLDDGDDGATIAEEIRADLAGKDLGCYCSLTAPCHADVLLEIANAGASGEEQTNG